MTRARGFSGMAFAVILCSGPVRAADPAPPSASAPTRAQGRAGAEPAGNSAEEGDKPSGAVVATEESQEGVKTYAFGAVEVEGRLRSPQILYFLRRVRAAFDAEGLGHRSFLRELSDTRRHPALR
jgi:hypothetical protein